jgi:hypothetical protein
MDKQIFFPRQEAEPCVVVAFSVALQNIIFEGATFTNFAYILSIAIQNSIATIILPNLILTGGIQTRIVCS